MKLILEAQNDIIGQLQAQKKQIYTDLYNRLLQYKVEEIEKGVYWGYRKKPRDFTTKFGTELVEIRRVSTITTFILHWALDDDQYGFKLTDRYFSQVPGRSEVEQNKRKTALRYLLKIVENVGRRYHNMMCDRYDSQEEFQINAFNRDIPIVMGINSSVLYEQVEDIRPSDPTEVYREWLRNYRTVLASDKSYITRIKSIATSLLDEYEYDHDKDVLKSDDNNTFNDISSSITNTIDFRLSLTINILRHISIDKIITEAWDEDYNIAVKKCREIFGHDLISKEGDTTIFHLTIGSLERKHQAPLQSLFVTIANIVKQKLGIDKPYDQILMKSYIKVWYEKNYTSWE